MCDVSQYFIFTVWRWKQRQCLLWISEIVAILFAIKWSISPSRCALIFLTRSLANISSMILWRFHGRSWYFTHRPQQFNQPLRQACTDRTSLLTSWSLLRLGKTEASGSRINSEYCCPTICRLYIDYSSDCLPSLRKL